MLLRRLLLTLCLGASAAALTPPAAHANMAAARPNPTQLRGPVLSPTPLRVTGETLRFDCYDEDGARFCLFDARYALVNPSTASEDLVGAFYGLGLERVSLSLDGESVHAELPPEVGPALDARVSPPPRAGRQRPAPTRGPSFALTLAPQQSGTLRAQGRIALGATWAPEGYAPPAHRYRHLFFGSRDYRPTGYQLAYWISPIRTLAPEPISIEVQLSAPLSWGLRLAPVDPRAHAGIDGGATFDGPFGDGERQLLRKTVRSDAVDILMVAATVPPPSLYIGGPFIGVGTETGDTGGVRARAGFELAGPSWMLWRASLDTNFDKLWVVAPAAEFALPGLAIIPSLGVGLGLPLQIQPELTPGLRLLATVHLPLVGVAFTHDIYPGEGRPDRFSIIARFSP